MHFWLKSSYKLKKSKITGISLFTLYSGDAILVGEVKHISRSFYLCTQLLRLTFKGISGLLGGLSQGTMGLELKHSSRLLRQMCVCRIRKPANTVWPLKCIMHNRVNGHMITVLIWIRHFRYRIYSHFATILPFRLAFMCCLIDLICTSTMCVLSAVWTRAFLTAINLPWPNSISPTVRSVNACSLNPHHHCLIGRLTHSLQSVPTAEPAAYFSSTTCSSLELYF